MILQPFKENMWYRCAFKGWTSTIPWFSTPQSLEVLCVNHNLLCWGLRDSFIYSYNNKIYIYDSSSRLSYMASSTFLTTVSCCYTRPMYGVIMWNWPWFQSECGCSLPCHQNYYHASKYIFNRVFTVAKERGWTNQDNMDHQLFLWHFGRRGMMGKCGRDGVLEKKIYFQWK